MLTESKWCLLVMSLNASTGSSTIFFCSDADTWHSSEEGSKDLTRMHMVNKLLRIALSSLLFSGVKRCRVVHPEIQVSFFICWSGNISLKILLKHKERGKRLFFCSRWKHLGNWEVGAEQLIYLDTDRPCFSAYSLEQQYWKLLLMTSKKEVKGPEARIYAFHLTHMILPLWWGHLHQQQRPH